MKIFYVLKMKFFCLEFIGLIILLHKFCNSNYIFVNQVSNFENCIILKTTIKKKQFLHTCAYVHSFIFSNFYIVNMLIINYYVILLFLNNYGVIPIYIIKS